MTKNIGIVAILTQSRGETVMYNIWIDHNLCDGCGVCVSICPRKVLSISKEINKRGISPAIVTSLERCTGCNLCELSCPQLAIYIEKLERRDANS